MHIHCTFHPTISSNVELTSLLTTIVWLCCINVLSLLSHTASVMNLGKHYFCSSWRLLRFARSPNAPLRREDPEPHMCHISCRKTPRAATMPLGYAISNRVSGIYTADTLDYVYSMPIVALL